MVTAIHNCKTQITYSKEVMTSLTSKMAQQISMDMVALETTRSSVDSTQRKQDFTEALETTRSGSSIQSKGGWRPMMALQTPQKLMVNGATT